MHAPACVHCARRYLTALCAAAAYRLGSTGSDACPAGSTRLDSATVCQGAVAALGRYWGGVCFLYLCPHGLLLWGFKRLCLLQHACDRRQFRVLAAAVLRWCAPFSTAAL